MTEEIDWGELGESWWREAGANCHATEQQIIFALHRHKGMTATGCARAAGYAGDDATIRQAGHRAAHSTAVMGLLSMAKAETGKGPDGNVTMDEAKQILSRLARGSDPNVRIKAIESLAKIEKDERELNMRQAGTGALLGRVITGRAMARSTAEIVESLSEADQAAVAKIMARIELALERRRLISILEPYIRQWIKEEINKPFAPE